MDFLWFFLVQKAKCLNEIAMHFFIQRNLRNLKKNLKIQKSEMPDSRRNSRSDDDDEKRERKNKHRYVI